MGLGLMALKWAIWIMVIALWISPVRPMSNNSAQSLPKHSPDSYTVALQKALMFFNAQKSGKLPKSNGVPWRGDSGLLDGSKLKDVKGGLVGGYYDSGENTKFHFPLAFSMTMLSWSMIEYPHKYHAIHEYDHLRELIKWGTDYLLLTFDSNAPKINQIHSQVGGAYENSKVPDDFSCWERPEDMDYPRPVQTAYAGPELAGEMAAALASASIVFNDNPTYSKKLIKGAEALFAFARDPQKRRPYSRGNPWIEPYYNSTGYYDEYLWGATWLYYATGNVKYLMLATNPGIAKNAMTLRWSKKSSILSWDNKIPAALMLLTRIKMLNATDGYASENMLSEYQKLTAFSMCSYLKPFHLFSWSKGGLIQLNDGGPHSLQYVANAAFLANLFADYLNATGSHGWFCGTKFFTLATLRDFASSQIDYILGNNPLRLSYVVGFGDKYPKQVHHRAASIPSDGQKYSCKDGYKWRDSTKPNPNTIEGAMIGGPDKFDHFHDDRRNRGSAEPTLAGNAGLVAALVSLTSDGGNGVDKNFLFSNLPPP